MQQIERRIALGLPLWCVIRGWEVDQKGFLTSMECCAGHTLMDDRPMCRHGHILPTTLPLVSNLANIWRQVQSHIGRKNEQVARAACSHHENKNNYSSQQGPDHI